MTIFRITDDQIINGVAPEIQEGNTELIFSVATISDQFPKLPQRFAENLAAENSSSLTDSNPTKRACQYQMIRDKIPHFLY